ncbi:MAG: threonine--tRNA ligase, partial [Bdellovibrionales bacterium]|nr:threonine--tRNA ligase [Bdellovibrionales bacterium]
SVVYNELVNYMRDLYLKYGYEEVITPQIFDVELFKQSGHIKNYKDNMYFSEIENREFSMKPMNCPAHCVLFGMEHHSYKELPLRMADFGRLHRYERSGVMHGLTRVRSFCQDDGHIFCAIDQVPAEITKFVDLLNEVYGKLELKYKVFLSTRPEMRDGRDEDWDIAEKALAKAMDDLKMPYEYQPGEGAFYGPKIEFNVTDAIGRNWQLGTIQCDFVQPEKFDLKFVGEDNKDHRPVMLHRAVLGSLERFIGVYLEHTAGKLPTWLSPVQVQILNVTDKQADYCNELTEMCRAQGVRVHFDSRNEKLGYKIREATLKRIPYMLIIGDKELETRTVSTRLRDGTNKNNLEINTFLQTLKQEVSERSSTSLISNL